MKSNEEAAQAAGEALEQALLKATRAVEAELTRVLKRGEDDLDRLVGRIGEALARLAIDGVLNASSIVPDSPAHDDRGEDAPSANQVATALMRAARRGGRFV